MWDIILDTIIDSLKMLPFLFAAYLLIEFIEHKSSGRMEAILARSGRLGPIGGALLGCFPQCGFSVLAANLYAGRVVTVGTMIAVFISTSDEAIPVLLSYPGNWGIVLKLILFKVGIALAAGLLMDLFSRWFSGKGTASGEKAHIHKNICAHCGCEHSIFRAALKHTLNIFIFLLLVSFILNAVIAMIGEERLQMLLMTGSIFQPVMAAIVGLIPNCASSVVLTKLFLAGTVSFGSLIAGLSSGAGMGLLVLFRVNKDMKANCKVLLAVVLIGMIAGSIIQLLGI